MQEEREETEQPSEARKETKQPVEESRKIKRNTEDSLKQRDEEWKKEIEERDEM